MNEKNRLTMNAYDQMRDALEMCLDTMCRKCRVWECKGWRTGVSTDREPCTAYIKAKAALSAPARQCDVGTADEQAKRYDEYCYQNRTIEHCCANCPVVSSATCELAWAQMPYEAEEGGAE